MLGVVELYAFAAGIAALIAGCVVFVRSGETRVDASRQLRPARVHAGWASRVELTLRNTTQRPTSLLVAVDPFDNGRRWAKFLVAPLAAGERARAAYRLPTERRGIFPLGPLQVRREDPFGIAVAVMEAAPTVNLTVFPRIDEIDPLPYTYGQDPLAGADHPTALGPTGDELYALRAYEMGDDLRRVHWKSTAKLDELMIRQDEMPWQGRATIVLDLRASVHSPASLELAVSAAASIVAASWRRRALLRLLTTDGTDSGFASGHAHTDAILERLAVTGLDYTGDLRRVLAALHRGGNSGALTVITTAGASDAELSGAARLSARYGEVITVLFDKSAYDPWAKASGARPRKLPAMGTVVRVDSDTTFAEAWETTVGKRARRRPLVPR